MKRFKITLLIPHSKEVVVADAQAAHNTATHLANQPSNEQDHPPTVVHSIEEIEDVVTEPIDFGLELDPNLPD